MNSSMENQVDNDKLNDALAAVMGNPELLSQIKTIAQNTNAENAGDSNNTDAEKEKTINTSNNTTAEKPASTPVSSDLLMQLPGIINMLAPMMNNSQSGAPRASSEQKNKTFRHEKLLDALKPYMNETRCDSIDKIMQLSKLTEVIETAAPLINQKKL